MNPPTLADANAFAKSSVATERTESRADTRTEASGSVTNMLKDSIVDNSMREEV
jgi:hypothetical protein